MVSVHFPLFHFVPYQNLSLATLQFQLHLWKQTIVFLLLNYVISDGYGGDIRDNSSLNILKNIVTEEVSLVFPIIMRIFAQKYGYHGE